jgi:3-oxoacyl-[acyl-carrier protein] reductase
MELNLHDRKVLVTGGSKGIGAACARVFLEEGCTVVLCARDAALLAQTAAELGTQSSVETQICRNRATESALPPPIPTSTS